MSDNISKDAKEIKEELLHVMGQTDIDENAISDLLKSIGPGYEVNSVIEMIAGPSNTTDSGLQSMLDASSSLNVASVQCVEMEEAKDLVIVEDTRTVNVTVDLTVSDSDEDTDSYYRSTSYDNVSTDSTRSSPLLLGTLEHLAKTSSRTDSHGDRSLTESIIISEENNNDPNNNLDSVQLHQEQGSSSAAPGTDIPKAKVTETLHSPKPSCSKNFYSDESYKGDDELNKQTIEICNLLPTLRYSLVYKTLQTYSDAKNRVELTLRDLLHDERPVIEHSSKRKVVEDACVIEREKKPSKTPHVELDLFTDEKNDIAMQDDNHHITIANKTINKEMRTDVGDKSTAAVFNGKLSVGEKNAHNPLNVSDHSICTEFGIQRLFQDDRPQKEILQPAKLILNNKQSQSATHVPSIKSPILAPAKLIVNNNQSQSANHVLLTKSPILAPAKLTYMAEKSGTNHTMSLHRAKQRTKSAEFKIETHTSLDMGINRMNSTVPNVTRDTNNSHKLQSMDNYMRYLEMRVDNKKYKLSSATADKDSQAVKHIAHPSAKKNKNAKSPVHLVIHKGRILGPGEYGLDLVSQAKYVKCQKTDLSKVVEDYIAKRRNDVQSNTDDTNTGMKTVTPNDVSSGAVLSGFLNLPSKLPLATTSLATEAGNLLVVQPTSISQYDSQPLSPIRPTTSIAATPSSSLLQTASTSTGAIKRNQPSFNVVHNTSIAATPGTLLPQTASTSTGAISHNQLSLNVAPNTSIAAAPNRSSPQTASTSTGAISRNQLSLNVAPNTSIAAAPSRSSPQTASTSTGAINRNQLSLNVAPNTSIAAAPSRSSPQTASTSTGAINRNQFSFNAISNASLLGTETTTPTGVMHNNHSTSNVASNTAPTPAGSSSTSTTAMPIEKKKEEEVELTPEMLEIYYKLLAVLPHLDRNYMKKTCLTFYNSRAYIDSNDILENLIDHMLEHGDKHLSVVDVEHTTQQEAFDMDERYSYLSGIFPNADPEYLRKVVKRLYNNPEGMMEYIQSQWKEPTYPTREQMLERTKITEQQKQYLNNFDVKQFLEVFSDPFAHFEDPKRKCKFSNDAVEFLKHRFNRTKVATISQVYSQKQNHLSLTAQALENVQPDMKTVRYTAPKLTEDIPLLQECAFITHKAEIKNYLTKLKAAEAAEFRKLKERKELLECQCCYDNECMPSKCSTCNDGHVFCNSCIIRGTETRLADGNTHFPCFMNCDGEFSLSTLQRILPPTQFSILLHKWQEAEVMAAGVEGLVSCPFCHFATIPPPDDKVFKCLNPECMKESCRNCREVNHVPLRCNEIKTDRARLLLEEKMTEALVRKCYRCSRPYFKEDGCNKIQCTCGALMCYLCDKAIKDYSHFYEGGVAVAGAVCPLWSDNHYINAAAVRQVAEETLKQIQEQDPTVDVNTNGLLPQLPPKVYVGRVNAHRLPERANRVIQGAQ